MKERAAAAVVVVVLPFLFRLRVLQAERARKAAEEAARLQAERDAAARREGACLFCASFFDSFVVVGLASAASSELTAYLANHSGTPTRGGGKKAARGGTQAC